MKSPQRHGYPSTSADIARQLDDDFDEMMRAGYSSAFARSIVESHEAGYLAAVAAIAHNPLANQNMFADYDTRFDAAYTAHAMQRAA